MDILPSQIFLQTKPVIYGVPLFQHYWKMAFLLLNNNKMICALCEPALYKVQCAPVKTPSALCTALAS